MSDYRVFITTCNSYIPALQPMAYMMRKYWHPMPDVVVIGFDRLPDFDLPANWVFASLGPQENYPFNKWSDAVMDFLLDVDDDVFLLMLEDMWPIRKVDTEALDILYHYMQQFQYVAKMDVCGDRLYAMGAVPYGYVSRIDLMKSMPGSPYHMSLMPGFWRKKHMLNALVRGESPHQVELVGTTRLSHMQDVIVLGTRQWPLRVCLALRGGDAGRLLTDEIDATDLAEMRQLGFLKTWEGG
jgi:hypothetical protein